MKKIVAIVLTAILVCTLLPFGIFAGEPQEFVSQGSDWQYLEYEEVGVEGPEGWMTGEDSEDWYDGTAPLGNSTNGNVITPMSWNNFSCFMRQSFTVEDTSSLSGLGMNIIYDENPVVYINGEEVWAASGYKDSGYTFVNLEEYASVLKEGENYIAVYFENALGGAILDLDLVIRGTQNEDGSFVYKSAESFDGDGNPKSNPWGAIGDVSNMFDANSSSIWGFPYVENMNVIVEYYDTFVLESITVACKDEGPVAADETHGTYMIEALVGDEWVVIAEEVQVYAYDMFMEESTVTVEDTIETNTIKVTITSWSQDLIDGNIWGGIAELEVRGTSTTAEPTPEPTPTPTPTPEPTPTPVEPTPTPDTTPVEPTPTPVVTPDGTTTTPETTPAGTATPVAPSTDNSSDPDENNNLVTIIIIVVAVVAVAAVVFVVIKKKK